METYEDYLARMEPKYTVECIRCGHRYFSDDGESWVEDNGERYNYLPCKGPCCIECETAEAVRDLNHWAAKEVLYTGKAIKEILRDTLNQPDYELQNAAIVQISKALLTVDEYRDSAREYLDEHWADVRAELEANY